MFKRTIVGNASINKRRRPSFYRAMPSVIRGATIYYHLDSTSFAVRSSFSSYLINQYIPSPVNIFLCTDAYLCTPRSIYVHRQLYDDMELWQLLRGKCLCTNVFIGEHILSYTRLLLLLLSFLFFSQARVDRALLPLSPYKSIWIDENNIAPKELGRNITHIRITYVTALGND